MIMDEQWLKDYLAQCDKVLANYDRCQEGDDTAERPTEDNPLGLVRADEAYQQQCKERSRKVVEELGENPLLHLMADESHQQFRDTTESILKQSKTESTGDTTRQIPRIWTALQVFAELGLVQEMPTDEEEARRLVRRLASKEWDRLAEFINRPDAIERLTSLAEMA